MKKIILILIAAITLLIPTGCEDQLQENLYSVLGEGSFPVESHVEPMLNEAYSRAEYALLTHRRLHWAIEYTGPAFMYQVRANHERQSFAEWDWQNAWGNPAYYDLWDRCYKTVRSCNDLIALAPDVEMDETKKQEAIGAAKFLRALVYNYMVQLWGGVPIIDKPIALTDDLYPTRASIAQTYEFIISDLLAAAEVLPTRSETVANGTLGFPTETAALGLLAKVYVTMSGFPLQDASKLDLAKTTLEKVISSGEHKLMSTFPEVFAWDNDNNEEFLYALQLVGADGPAEYFYFYSWPREKDIEFLDPETLEPTGEVGIMPPGQGGIKYDLIMPEFADWFKARDNGPRYQWSILTHYASHGEVFDYRKDHKSAAYCVKFRCTDPQFTDRVRMPNNFPFIRYSDILLLYAEVLNEKGMTTDAYEYINMVRERAELEPYSGLGQSELRQAIRDEREMEFVGEMHSLLDLRRYGYDYAKQRMENSYEQETNGYPEFHIQVDPADMLFPIPSEQINANPNLEQNPGY